MVKSRESVFAKDVYRKQFFFGSGLAVDALYTLFKI